MVIENSEKVCDICGYPITNYGKEEKLIRYNGHWYCEDRCLNEAKEINLAKQLKEDPLYEDINSVFGHKAHESEIVELVKKLRKKYNIY